MQYMCVRTYIHARAYGKLFIHFLDKYNTFAFDRKLMVLVGHLSILTRFCPVSCCYHSSACILYVHMYVV